MKVTVPPSSSLFYFLTLSKKIKHTLSLLLCTFSHTPFSPIPSLFSSIFLLNQLLFSLLFLSPTSLFLLLLLFSFNFFLKVQRESPVQFPISLSIPHANSSTLSFTSPRKNGPTTIRTYYLLPTIIQLLFLLVPNIFSMRKGNVDDMDDTCYKSKEKNCCFSLVQL